MRSRSRATGFSQNVGMSREMAASSSSAWAAVPAVMTKASRPESSRASMLGAAPTPRSVATRSREGGVEVGEHEVVDAVERGQGLGVEGADPAGAGKADAHVRVLRVVEWVCRAQASVGGQPGVDREVGPGVAHPGVGGVVADQPGALGARAGHDVEVVQVGVRGGHRRAVPAVRHEHDVTGAHLGEHVDRPLRRCRRPAGSRRHRVPRPSVGLRLELVDLLELGLDARRGRCRACAAARSSSCRPG